MTVAQKIGAKSTTTFEQERITLLRRLEDWRTIHLSSISCRRTGVVNGYFGRRLRALPKRFDLSNIDHSFPSWIARISQSGRDHY